MTFDEGMRQHTVLVQLLHLPVILLPEVIQSDWRAYEDNTQGTASEVNLSSWRR